MTEPRQRPGASRQDYSTPKNVLDAVGNQFGRIDFDLATMN